MDDELKDLANHMEHFGLNLIGHAVEHALEVPFIPPFWHAFGVLHAAQAGDIIIKSCIAKEHPLLIFNKYPTSSRYPDQSLSMQNLLESGVTLNYSELPDRLWAATGYVIQEINIYHDFGKLRNRVQHLAVPNQNLPREIFMYICKVIDPMTRHFWKTGAFEEMIIGEDYIDYLNEGNVIKDHLDRYGIVYNGYLPGSSVDNEEK